MSLLQIAEPLSAEYVTAPRVVGIDLGTTHSLVARVADGCACTIPDEEGGMLLDSAVCYGAKGVVAVGADFLESQEGTVTITSVKRLMGRLRQELPVNLPYPLLEAQGGKVRLATPAGGVSPVEVSAEILRVLRERAEAVLGGALQGAVITVPAYFDEGQRQATKDAARLAGIPLLRLLNEPTAAAIAYGLDRQAESGVYLVYDLGGGTFDVSILKLTRGVFEVVGTGGDTHLGGDDFDQRIFEWMQEEGAVSAATTVEDDGASEGSGRLKAWQKGLRQARAVKEALTSSEQVQWDGRILTRAHFEALTVDLLEKTLAIVGQVLRDADLEPSALQGIVLVGGATRMPQVRRAVANALGAPVCADIDPDQVVALGAAWQADRLVAEEQKWLLLDVTPLSLGIETLDGLVALLIPRNTILPATRSQDFGVVNAAQTAMLIHVVQGERPEVSKCRSLARFELKGLPREGATLVRVTFQVDVDGMLSVTAKEVSTGTSMSVSVQSSHGLDESEILSILQGARLHKEEDAFFLAYHEEKNRALHLVGQVKKALAEDGVLLSPSERNGVGLQLAKLEGQLALASPGKSDLVALREAVAALIEETNEFASRRMDQAVSLALCGQSVDLL